MGNSKLLENYGAEKKIWEWKITENRTAGMEIYQNTYALYVQEAAGF